MINTETKKGKKLYGKGCSISVFMTVLAVAGWYPWCVGSPGRGNSLMGNAPLCRGVVSTELEMLGAIELEILEGTELGSLFFCFEDKLLLVFVELSAALRMIL